MSDRKPIMLAVTSERQLVLLAVGALGVSCVMTQLALMRELMGAFSGNEMVLGVVLGLWLLLMGIGAWCESGVPCCKRSSGQLTVPSHGEI